MKAVNELKAQHVSNVKEFNISHEVNNDKIDTNTEIVRQQTEKLDNYLKQIEPLQIESKQFKKRS